MEKYAILLLSLVFFVKLSFSQNEADSVIIAVQKDRLTQQELIEFDSLKNSMYDLDEVYYFRKIYRHINELEKFYHLSCTENEDSIFNVLNRKTFFDTVFYDHPSKPCCDNPVFATDPLDTTYVQDLIDLPCAWDITIGDTAIIIGIVDKHFYSQHHEDIINKVNSMYGPYYGDKRNNFQEPPPGDTVVSAHGLNMAGLTSAEVGNNKGISGITNKLSFNGYRLSDTGDPYLHVSEIHNAIDYASFEQQEKILNISYSDICLSDYGYESEDHDSLFYQNIVDNGTVIITSGGNVRYENKKEQIFDIPGVIVVGAINRENKILLDNPQYEYACNPYIEICAPGIGITTTHWEEGESSYINGNGTSASAAIVSGVIGLMLSTDNSLTPAEIEYILKTSADSIADYAAANTFVSNYYNESFVAGSLNAYHAVYKAKHFNDCMSNLIEDSENVSLLIDGFISDTLIVEGTLSVHAPLHMLHNLPHIIVRNGGQLIFEDGGGIFHWEDEIFNGDIIIEAGSTLEFKNGSDIVLAENGKIMVNHDSNNSGELVFNSGVSLTLLDDNTNLEIAGDLHIASNATFTFTGDGYIKFSNPGDDNTWNISCGTGASVHLEGSGQSDKIVEVQQSTVRFPQDLTSLTFKNGTIEMGDDKRMLATDDYDITFDNVKITSDDGSYNTHRSFHVYGQQNVTIEDCVFEYGKWGLFGNLTYNAGAPLTISNSEFRNNEAGLYIYNKGIHLDNCSFSNNTGNAIHCENMSMLSDFTDCSVVSNNYGVVYQGSSNADLNIDNSDISYNTQTGVKVNGAFDLDLTCNTINNNQYGVYTQNGSYLRMENYARNDVSNNQKSLYLDYGRLYLEDGYNQLQSVNNNYAVYGDIHTRATCGVPVYYSVEHNRWETSLSATPHMPDNYRLWVYNCTTSTEVILDDQNPDYQVCIQFNMLASGSQESETIATTNTTEASLESELLNLSLQADNLISESDYIGLINQYIDFITDKSPNTLINNNAIEIAWADLHDVIETFYKKVNLNADNVRFNQSVDQVMQLNAQLMLDADAIAYYEYALDNALLERLRGNFDESLLLLDNLIPELEGMDKETAYVNRWICHIEAEREAALRNITPEEFMDAVAICNTDYENTLESLSDNLEADENAEETTAAPEIHIVPNPNNGFFTLEISDCTEGSSVRISNVYSQPVFTQTFTESGTQTVQITGLSQGHYTVYYLENNAVISSENIVVE